MKEVYIVGGGLAGLSLGIALRKRGVPCRIDEAGSYPRHRICGEFMGGCPTDLQKELNIDRLGRNEDRCQWFAGNHAIAHNRLPEPAKVVSRWDLDATLAQTFGNLGGKLRTRHRVKEEDLPENAFLTKGRNRDPQSPWMGMKAHFESLSEPDRGLEMYLGKRCYVGKVHLGQGIWNVSGIFHKSLLRPGIPGPQKFSSLCQQGGLKQLASFVEKSNRVEGSLTGVSDICLGWHPQQMSPTAGDAMSVIPPLSGHGMTVALMSGWQAAPLLEAWSAERLSWEDLQRQLKDIQKDTFQRPMRFAGLFQKLALNAHIFSWLIPLIMRRPIFPQLVRLTRIPHHQETTPIRRLALGRHGIIPHNARQDLAAPSRTPKAAAHG